jgi:hypothetical protein
MTMLGHQNTTLAQGGGRHWGRRCSAKTSTRQEQLCTLAQRKVEQGRVWPSGAQPGKLVGRETS